MKRKRQPASARLSSRAIGTRAERRAVWHYRLRGFRILARNAWIAGYELDIVAEDEAFALEMERAYLADLENATELILRHDEMHRTDPVRRPGAERAGGSASRAVTGAIRRAARVRGRDVVEPHPPGPREGSSAGGNARIRSPGPDMNHPWRLPRPVHLTSHAKGPGGRGDAGSSLPGQRAL